MKCFTYALSPFTKKLVAVDWKLIVNDEIQGQHIRCHILQADDNLPELVSSFRKAHAKAVILVNTQESFTLAIKFKAGFDTSNYPVVIVLTKSDGVRLNELLDKAYGRTDIYARIVKEPKVRVELQLAEGIVKREASSLTSAEKKPEGKKIISNEAH